MSTCVRSAAAGGCLFVATVTGAAGIPEATLSLELVVPGTCQDEQTFEVEVWLRDVSMTNVTGWNAFVEFDQSLIDFDNVNSEYAPSPPSPFELHITPMNLAEFQQGKLMLDGSFPLDDNSGTSADTLLATLVFNVFASSECAPLSNIEFFQMPPFFTEASFDGVPIPTKLSDTTLMTFDETPPTITAPDDESYQCVEDVPACDPTLAIVSDNCNGLIDRECLADTDNGGAGCADDPLIITRTYQATDACGLSNTDTQTITVIDTTPPELGPPAEDLSNVYADVGTCEADLDPVPPNATDNCEGEGGTIECVRWIGTPLSNCCYPNGGQGCDNMECQIAVCTELPLCCTQEWDNICAANAENTNCVELCDIPGEVDTADCDDPYECGVNYTLRWTAVDACGNESDPVDQPVFVRCLNEIDLDITLANVFDDCTRCIHFVGDDCDATGDLELEFVAREGPPGMIQLPDPANFTGKVLIPCGDFTFVCMKDEQHTLYDTASVAINAQDNQYTSTPVTLLSGDTDNDSDVDINDVTWLVLQFGDLAQDGGCPWDGVTRDADFDCNGAVQSPDYTILSDNWMQFSVCACTEPTAPEWQLVFQMFNGLLGQTTQQTSIPLNQLPQAIAAEINYHPDNVFNWQDVAVWEQLNGLPNTLSSRILASSPGIPW